MNDKFLYETVGHRVAEEAQLLTEEKWIIDALEKVRKQRNCLQIERLQLESMKNQMKVSTSKSSVDELKQPRPAKTSVTSVTVNVDAMQNVTPTADVGSAKDHLMETEATCNKEELNLNVTKSVLSKLQFEDNNTEEEEDDDDEYDPEENGEELMIDMNMFMHGSQTNDTNPS